MGGGKVKRKQGKKKRRIERVDEERLKGKGQ